MYGHLPVRARRWVLAARFFAFLTGVIYVSHLVLAGAAALAAHRGEPPDPARLAESFTIAAAAGIPMVISWALFEQSTFAQREQL